MLSPYKISTTPDGYTFTTNSGTIYFLYFTEYYLKDNNGKDVKVQSFGFFADPPIVRKEGMSNKYDEKIKLTIVSFMAEYFSKNRDVGLLYVCDTADGYARHRRITFGRWYKEVNLPIEKFDCRETHVKAGLYTSIFVRKDNPLKDYLVEAFYRTLDEFFPNNS